MADIVVGIADMKVSKNPEDTIVTYSLGSCMGLTVYDPVVKVGGMIHIMLSDSGIDTSGNINPFKFVDTGIPLLFKESYKLGAVKQRIVIKMTGCSQIMDNNNFFNIGQRNLVAARKMFWKNGVLVAAEDVGGTVSRTIRLKLATGELLIATGSQKGKIL